MEKTNKKTLEEIIRVDHAGERGAIKIYEGQLLALKTFKQDEFLKKKIEEMKEHEKEHYEFFDKEIKKRKKVPILVGGTGLYFKALTEGLIEIPLIPSKFRNKIRSLHKSIGQEKFYKKLNFFHIITFSFGISSDQIFSSS